MLGRQLDDANRLRDPVVEYCRSLEQQFRSYPLLYPQFLSILDDFWNDRIDVKGFVERISAIYTEEPLLIFGFTPFLSPDLKIARTQSGRFSVTVSTARIDYRDICISPSVRYIHGRVQRHGQFPVTGGAFADIWTGTFENQKVAIKILRRFGINLSKYSMRLRRECRTWGELSHPNILPFLGVCLEYISETTLVPCLVSPWMDNGTVMDYITSYAEVDRVPLLAGIAEGIRYLHTRNSPVVHGDLRAGNVLVSSDGTPFLSDFGLSRMLMEAGGMTTSTVAGSTRWMSPELLEAQPVTTYSDVWAFGMIIIEVFTGKPPYQEVKNDAHMFRHIIKRQLPLRPNDAKDLDDKLWRIFLHCCAFKPLERETISSVFDQISGVSHAVETTLKFTATISSQAQVKRYKQKHEQGKTELRGVEATSQLYHQALKLMTDEQLLVTPSGGLLDIHVTAFLRSIDLLLTTGRSSPRGVYVQNVVNAVHAIIDDVRSVEAHLPKDFFDYKLEDLQALRKRVDMTLSNLVAAARTHATSLGMSPVSLLDAAASHVSSAVTDIGKKIQVRKATKAEQNLFNTQMSPTGKSGYARALRSVIESTRAHIGTMSSVEYKQVKTKLRTAKVTSPLQPQAPKSMTDDELFVTTSGGLPDIHVTAFLKSIDLLLTTGRSSTPTLVDEPMKAVVNAVHAIIDDVRSVEARPRKDRLHYKLKDLQALRERADVALGNLVAAARTHATSLDGSQVILLDEAASHVSRAVTEIGRTIQVREATLDEQKLFYTQMSSMNMSPTSVYAPARRSVRQSTRGHMRPVSSAGWMQGEDYSSSGTHANRPYRKRTPTPKATGRNTLSQPLPFESSNSYPSSPPAIFESPATFAASGLGSDELVSPDGSDNIWAELKPYLEAQSESIVYAIQCVLSAVRSPAPSSDVNENLRHIITILSSIIAICKDNLPSASLQEGNDIIHDLVEHCNKLSEIQAMPEITKESRHAMAKSSFAVASAMRDLVKLRHYIPQSFTYPRLVHYA